MPSVSTADIGLRDTKYIFNTRPSTYILIYTCTYPKERSPKHDNNREMQHYHLHHCCSLSSRCQGKELFNGTAHHSSELQHTDTLRVPYAAGAIKAPWQLWRLFQCHNKSLVLRSHALTPFFWELEACVFFTMAPPPGTLHLHNNRSLLTASLMKCSHMTCCACATSKPQHFSRQHFKSSGMRSLLSFISDKIWEASQKKQIMCNDVQGIVREVGGWSGLLFTPQAWSTPSP